MNFKDQFPVLNTSTYLNTAYSGILSESILSWRRTHDLDFYTQGSEFRIRHAELLQNTKINLGEFFNAKARSIFLVPNFSFGFNTFLNGLSSFHHFLLLEGDYPALNYAVQSSGFNCDYLRQNEQSEEIILDKIRIFKPTIFAFSIVQYISGSKISIDFIKKIKETFPNLLIVTDGTQFCGTASFDFENSGIDVLISSGYKWMLSGYGNGFVLIKDEVQEQLFLEAGKTPLPKEPFLRDQGLLSLHFEPGHQDTLSLGSLNQAILFFKQLGPDLIFNRIRLLSDKARSAFIERNLLDPTVALRKEHSSIYNLNLEDHFYLKLHEEGILCSSRGKGIRVSFHFYNTDQDLSHLLDVIDKNR